MDDEPCISVDTPASLLLRDAVASVAAAKAERAGGGGSGAGAGALGGIAIAEEGGSVRGALMAGHAAEHAARLGYSSVRRFVYERPPAGSSWFQTVGVAVQVDSSFDSSFDPRI